MHVVNEEVPRQPESWGSAAPPPEAPRDDEQEQPLLEMPSADDFPAGTFANDAARAQYALVESRFQRKRFAPAPKRRPSPVQRGANSGPPREIRDAKCANCNQTGHTAQECSRPKVEFSQRKCHKCGKVGHLARNCTEKETAPVKVVQSSVTPGRPAYALVM